MSESPIASQRIRSNNVTHDAVNPWRWWAFPLVALGRVENLDKWIATEPPKLTAGESFGNPRVVRKILRRHTVCWVCIRQSWRRWSCSYSIGTDWRLSSHAGLASVTRFGKRRVWSVWSYQREASWRFVCGMEWSLQAVVRQRVMELATPLVVVPEIEKLEWNLMAGALWRSHWVPNCWEFSGGSKPTK